MESQPWSAEGPLLAKLHVWQAPQEGVPRVCSESLAAGRIHTQCWEMCEFSKQLADAVAAWEKMPLVFQGLPR